MDASVLLMLLSHNRASAARWLQNFYVFIVKLWAVFVRETREV